MNSPELQYLCTGRYISSMMAAEALRSALQLGVIDRLAAATPTIDELSTKLSITPGGAGLLIDLLCANGVAEAHGDGFSLTSDFRHALGFRDYLEIKLEFLELVACDYHRNLSQLVKSPAEFFRTSAAYELFRYDLCLDPTPDNIARARRWMRLTTGLTRYEAAVLVARHDFSHFERIVDVGGNSGEMALRICRRHPDASVTVFDLPVVCHVGAEHVSREVEGKRIQFMPGDALGSVLPEDQDLVMFKSMLHDWPERHTLRLLDQARGALKQGGRVLIFERAPLELRDRVPPYFLIPDILFMHSYRPAEWYRTHLEMLGFTNFRREQVDLEVPFHLITAERDL